MTETDGHPSPEANRLMPYWPRYVPPIAVTLAQQLFQLLQNPNGEHGIAQGNWPWFVVADVVRELANANVFLADIFDDLIVIQIENHPGVVLANVAPFVDNDDLIFLWNMMPAAQRAGGTDE